MMILRANMRKFLSQAFIFIFFLINTIIKQGMPDDLITNHKCPNWLEEYKLFHDKNRENPEIKRLTYTCADSPDGTSVPSSTSGGVHHAPPFQKTCIGQRNAGFGDRMRAILWGLRLAAATDRVFHISHTSGIDLEYVLLPNMINWRPLKGKEYDDINQRPCAKSGGSKVHQSYFNQDSVGATTELFYNGNSHAAHPLPAWVRSNREKYDINAHYNSADPHCLFRFLFLPSPALTAGISHAITELFGSENATFAAFHFRGGEIHGDIENEENLFGNDIRRFFSGLHCLHQWNQVSFLASHDSYIRFATKSGLLTSNVRTVKKAHAIHPDLSHTTTAHLFTFIELGVLSRANCIAVSGEQDILFAILAGSVPHHSIALIVTIASGYSDLARWMGGNTRCVHFIDPTEAISERELSCLEMMNAAIEATNASSTR